jgi:hypothetical protein
MSFEEEKNRFRLDYKITNEKSKKETPFTVFSDVDRLSYSQKENSGKGGVLEFSNDINKQKEEVKDYANQKGSITNNLKNLFSKNYTSQDSNGNNVNHTGFDISLDEEIFSQIIDKINNKKNEECKVKDNVAYIGEIKRLL